MSDDALVENLSKAAERYAFRHSAALVFSVATDDVRLGSATCVEIGCRFLLATAGHNFDDVTQDEMMQVIPPNGWSEIPIPVLGRQAADYQNGNAGDVGWIEIDAEIARAHGLQAIPIKSIELDEEIDPKHLYLAHGLPAARTTHRLVGRTRELSLTSVGYLTLPPERPVEHTDETILLDYGTTAFGADGKVIPLSHPCGMSGGGIWSVTRGHEASVWSPEKCSFIGIIRGFRKSESLLAAVPVRRWLEFVLETLPDLRNDIPQLVETR